MPSYAGPTTPNRGGDVAGTLRLLAYLSLALVLVVLDHRGGWLNQARQQVLLLVQPLWMVAGWPVSLTSMPSAMASKREWRGVGISSTRT